LSKNYSLLKRLIDDEVKSLTEPEVRADTLVIKDELEAFIALFNGIELAMQEVFYVVINSLDKHASEGGTFRMFENINTRGKQLDQIDKIKNKFFSYVYDDFFDTKDGQKYVNLKDIWSSIIKKLDNRAEAFIRYYLIITIGRHIDEKYLYDEVVKYVDSEVKTKKYRKGDIVYSFINNLKANIDIFKFIDNPIHYPLKKLYSSHKKRHKEHIIQNITYANKYELLIPVLFKSVQEFHNDKLSIEDLYEITGTCSSFYISLKLAGRSPKDYFKSIVQLISKYFKEKKDSNSRTFSEYIHEKDTLAYLDIKLLFDNKDNFIKLLSQYTDLKINQLLIHKLESYLNGDTQEAIEYGKYQVEHIWPTKGRGDWQSKKDEALDYRDELTFNLSLNRIGNLMLLEEKINKNCSNREFQFKIEEYRSSSRATVANFIQWCKKESVDDFDFYSLEKRSKYLSEIIYDSDLLRVEKKLKG
jgi:hypothetical protein